MKKFWLLTLILIGTLALTGCGADSESAIKDDSGGGLVVGNTSAEPENVPSNKTLTVLEGETEQYVNSVLYKSELGYSTYLIEKFQVKQGDGHDEIISESYPQNKMVISLMPSGTKLDALIQKVQNQLGKDYPQVSAVKEDKEPLKSSEINALGGNGYKRVFLFQRGDSVYKAELYFDDYGQESMLPRFYAMLKEMHF